MHAIDKPVGGLHPVTIDLPDAALEGDLVVSPSADALVVFAHGSGSDRLSPRNRYVARILQDAGLGTLLVDLLTDAEVELDRQTGLYRADADLLARRLMRVTTWLAREPRTEDLRIGYFGAGLGAAAALRAAAQLPHCVRAVVARGGEPDLAWDALAQIACPTLLIAGSRDREALRHNRAALTQLRHGRLEIVHGVSRLLDEPGALDQVAGLAQRWFAEHVTAGRVTIRTRGRR
jgi:dienelactone hydrolase